MEEITVADIKKLDKPLVVDVRSPDEYEEDRLPEAINLPVLNNDQHQKIGTIYNKDSEFTARREGAKIICKRIPDLIDEIENTASSERPILVYCSRGGLRSQSLAIILDKIGYNIHRLKGGYKAYRQQIHEYFQTSKWNTPIVTIFGLTGSGKTRLLELLSESGESTVDLESAANHRGSVFGGAGLDEQPSQKLFERRIYQELFEAEAPIFIEGESRKIGKRTIPNELFDDLVSSPKIWLESSLESRAHRIKKQYPWPECRDEIVDQISNLKERLGSSTVKNLQEKLKNDELDPVVKTLLKEYYDPAYENSIPDRSEFDLVIDGEETSTAAKKLRSWSKNI